MGYLKKRGRYYYVRYYLPVNGRQRYVTKSLKTRHKDVAQKMLRDLQKLASMGKIDPGSPGFDPLRSLRELHKPKVTCKTVRQAADLYYEKKQHLSGPTIDAYKRAIEHFIELNELGQEHPKMVTADHFEAIILKPGIKSPTRHFYFRQLRAWWNWMLRKEIVTENLPAVVKQELPRKKENTRPKMITEAEFNRLVEVFDQDLDRKKRRPDYKQNKVQHWFKPLMAVYYYAGLRKHEAAWSPDLDYSGLQGENLIYDGQGTLSYIWLEATKGRRERLIPIRASLRDYLEQYLEIRGKIGLEDYLFIYMHGKCRRPVRGDRAYREFKRYAKMAGIPRSRTIHGMRHRAITSWIEDGFHTAQASFMAGHSTQNVTEKYTHLTVRKLKEKMDRLD